MADYQHGVPINIVDTFRVAGAETNPTTVVYSILGPDGTLTTYTWPGAVEIINVSVGQFRLSLAPPTFPGLYQYDVDATGAVVASRAGSFTVLADVTEDHELTWAVGGPCTPWASSQDAWNCCGQPTETIEGDVCNVDFSSHAAAASQILYELSGRRFPGVCEKTVRPCGESQCGFQVLSRGYVVGWGDVAGWQWNGYHSCGCQPLDRVLLSGYPVRGIEEVKIDGAIVDPTTYRLDERRYLTRVRDPLDLDTQLFWPNCQDLDKPDTAEGTFSVTYRYGMDPPLIGSSAAAALACQLYRSCGNDGECVLPAATTRVTRQGVTIDKLATLSWFYAKESEKGWQTGIPAVDMFLSAYATQSSYVRPKVWSPDARRYARPVGQ